MTATRLAAAFVLALAVVTRAEVQTYVIVIDDERHPVVGLSTEDFYLREGGLRLGLLDARPAALPLEIAVVIDGFDASDRAALTSAISTAKTQLAKVDERHRMSAPDIAAATGTGNRPSLIDAVIDASASLRDADTDRRAVLAIIRRRAGDGTVSQPSRLTSTLLRDRVSLWTIEVGAAQTSPLDKALADTAANGGALREIVPSTAAMGAAANHIIELMTSQYVVTYRWPNPMLSSAFYITTRHDRGAVLVTAWMR